MKKIIIDDAVPFAKEIFSSLGKVTCIAGNKINSKHLVDADALIIRSRTKITPPLLTNSKVQFIGSTVVGLDHVDQNYLLQNNIQFYSAQGCNANSVAEFVITCIVNYAKENNIILKNKTLGIIGVGNVGRLLQQKAITLGLKILANDPPRQQQKNKHNFVDLNSVLNADIVSFHTPLIASGNYPTKHLLNKENFKLIKPQALIINAARGGIIDEKAWLNYAKQHPTLTSIIDCWQDEPNINPKLYAIAKIATPHIAGHALDAKIKGTLMVYQKLCKLWNIKKNNHWKNYLPKPPPTIKLIQYPTNQQTIYQLLKKCYQPNKDHQAINLTNSTEFEYYRRHYPTRREWSEHSIEQTTNQQLNNTLIKLGFILI